MIINVRKWRKEIHENLVKIPRYKKVRIYYLKCALFDAVMIGKPLFYGKTNDRDLWIFSEDTPTKEGNNLLFTMCTLDGVIIGKPLFCGKTNDIIGFFMKKCSNFLWYKCRKWHLKDDSTVVSEDLNMDVTWGRDKTLKMNGGNGNWKRKLKGG